MSAFLLSSNLGNANLIYIKLKFLFKKRFSKFKNSQKRTKKFTVTNERFALAESLNITKRVSRGSWTSGLLLIRLLTWTRISMIFFRIISSVVPNFKSSFGRKTSRLISKSKSLSDERILKKTLSSRIIFSCFWKFKELGDLIRKIVYQIKLFTFLI